MRIKKITYFLVFGQGSDEGLESLLDGGDFGLLLCELRLEHRGLLGELQFESCDFRAILEIVDDFWRCIVFIVVVFVANVDAGRD